MQIVEMNDLYIYTICVHALVVDEMVGQCFGEWISVLYQIVYSK